MIFCNPAQLQDFIEYRSAKGAVSFSEALKNDSKDEFLKELASHTAANASQELVRYPRLGFQKT